VHVCPCHSDDTLHQGFFYAHIGWMLLKQKPNQIGRADISDLNADAMIRFQVVCVIVCATTS
jgi:fatty-acid desaturase